MRTSGDGTDARIADLLRLRDEVGVLSLYVGIDPAEEARARPAWRIRLDKDVQAIQKRLRAEHDHARRMAVEERLQALTPTLADLTKAAEPGRGRALFAGVRSGEVHTFALQVALPTEATLGEIARLMPLLRVDDGHPRGVILVGRDAVRVLEARYGRAVQLQAHDVEPVVYDHDERKGPVASDRLRGQKVSTQRERWDRHVEADHARRLARAAGRVGRVATARGWELGVVAGDPRGAHALIEALVKAGVATELVDRDLVDLTPMHALAELAPVLDAVAQRRDLALVSRTRDAAAGGGRAAVGLDAVLAALEEGLVETLLLDGDRQALGTVAVDGRLIAARPGVEADPQFADRLVQRAFETRARSRVVVGAAGAALAGVDGVAAVLRG